MTTNGKLTPENAIRLARENGVQMVDLKFVDIPGTLQHLSLPVGELTPELFSEGTGFDGSSIRDFQAIEESDILLVPDPTTAAIDPVYDVPSLSLICDSRDRDARLCSGRCSPVNWQVCPAGAIDLKKSHD